MFLIPIIVFVLILIWGVANVAYEIGRQRGIDIGVARVDPKVLILKQDADRFMVLKSPPPFSPDFTNAFLKDIRSFDDQIKAASAAGEGVT